jgi:hypothetical protein
MTTKRLTVIAAGLGILLAVGNSGHAYAWVKNFSGTRDQVRTACASVGGDLIEGVDSKGIGTSTCINGGNNTGVTCGDDGKCTGSGPRTASWGIYELPGLSGGINSYTPGSSLIEQDSESSSGHSGGGVIIY